MQYTQHLPAHRAWWLRKQAVCATVYVQLHTAASRETSEFVVGVFRWGFFCAWLLQGFGRLPHRVVNRCAYVGWLGGVLLTPCWCGHADRA